MSIRLIPSILSGLAGLALAAGAGAQSTQRISIHPVLGEPLQPALRPTISGDGQLIAWDMNSFDDVADGTGDIWLHNLSTGAALTLETHFRDTIGYGVAAEYELNPEWTVSAGISYASSPVSKSNRLAALPFDRQVRYGTGVRHQLDETTTVALSYEYLDLGSSKLSDTNVLGTIAGDYHRNKVQFLALTLSKSF